PGADLAAARAAVAATRAPVRVLEISTVDGNGDLTAALVARPGELWVIRPDAHVAAVVTDRAGLTAALNRVLAVHDPTRKVTSHGVLPAGR
ncbi:MAG TPA: pentachlorophenol monooxygenase, partial [Amycolatopsis sp.]|nr:pentachlorophenol monooxygenase [Amycolatopsis sp.]